MTKKEQDFLNGHDKSFAMWKKQGIAAIKKNAPLLSDEQAYEVFKISIKSFEDVRACFSYHDAHRYIEYIR